MARIRSIKPSFFTSEDVSDLPFRARLTWIGLWTHCDDAGRAKDNVKLIKAALWPLDSVTLADVEEDLTVLAAYGRIVRYDVDGKGFLHITNWNHQRIDKPTRSVLPPPSTNAQRTFVEDGQIDPVRKGGEGKGGDARAAVPPFRCPEHTGVTDAPPCKGCGDARREHDAWKIHQKLAPTPTPGAGPLEECPDHQGQPRSHCSGCAADRKAAS